MLHLFDWWEVGRLGRGLQASKLPQGFVKDKMAMAGGAGGLLCDENLFTDLC